MTRLLAMFQRRRGTPLGLRPRHLLAGSEPCTCYQATSAAVGIVVIFTTFLTPFGFVMSSLKQFRRQ